MKGQRNRVAIVVPPDAGALLASLVCSQDVWVVDTRENRTAAERIWASSSGDVAHGLTTFKVDAGSPRDAWVAGVLPIVDEHHGLRAEWPAHVELDVHGVGLTEIIRCVLAALGSFVIHERPEGFRASRRAAYMPTIHMKTIE
jgi:hypothetical protein